MRVSLTWAFLRNMPELVRTSLSTLSPESLSATIDFSNLSLAYSYKLNQSKSQIDNVLLRDKSIEHKTKK